MLIKVLMILVIAGNAPMFGENSQVSFDTVKACEDALPALDVEAEAHFKNFGKARGSDYEFKLKCIETNGTPAGQEKI